MKVNYTEPEAIDMLIKFIAELCQSESLTQEEKLNFNIAYSAVNRAVELINERETE